MQTCLEGQMIDVSASYLERVLYDDIILKRSVFKKTDPTKFVFFFFPKSCPKMTDFWIWKWCVLQ